MLYSYFYFIFDIQYLFFSFFSFFLGGPLFVSFGGLWIVFCGCGLTLASCCEGI